jgi:DNA polymerase III delta subunit
MLYAIYGTDRQKARKKLTELADALQKKRPDAPVIRIDPQGWSEGLFSETLAAAGLFSPKNIVILDSLIEHPDSSELVAESLDSLAASEHVYILIEGKIKAGELKKIEKKAEKVQEYNIAASGETKKYFPETFAFAEAVAAKDKVRAWKIFQHLVDDSLAAEEIHGVLWWQFKSLALAKVSKSAKEAGLNPFVYGKCQGYLSKWDGTEGESLDAMLAKIAGMYHLAHRGEIDFMSELESLSLS